MLIRRPSDVKSSDITPESLYYGRREFIAAAAAALGSAAVPSLAAAFPRAPHRAPRTQDRPDTPTPIEDVTGNISVRTKIKYKNTEKTMAERVHKEIWNNKLMEI